MILGQWQCAVVTANSTTFYNGEQRLTVETSTELEIIIYDTVINRLSKAKAIETFDVATERAICGREGKVIYSLSDEYDKTIALMRLGKI